MNHPSKKVPVRVSPIKFSALWNETTSDQFGENWIDPIEGAVYAADNGTISDIFTNCENDSCKLLEIIELETSKWGKRQELFTYMWTVCNTIDSLFDKWTFDTPLVMLKCSVRFYVWSKKYFVTQCKNLFSFQSLTLLRTPYFMKFEIFWKVKKFRYFQNT